MKLFLSTVIVTLTSIFSLNLYAGTIFFKNGTKLSDIKIISISDGEIVLEKSKVRKSYSLKLFKAYYDADFNTGGESSPDKYIDYKINIIDIKVPKKGADSKKKAESVEIQYTISKKSGPGKKIKVPYFYLYVLTTAKDDNGRRKIYSYYAPKQAKPKSKGYDVASMLSKALEFSRPEWNIDHTKARNKLMGKTVKIELKSIAERKVLAWHLEVWGNKDKIYEKSGVECPEAGIGKTWWKRFK